MTEQEVQGHRVGMCKISGKNEKIQVSNSGSALGRAVASLGTILNLLYPSFVFCKMKIRLSD